MKAFFLVISLFISTTVFSDPFLNNVYWKDFETTSDRQQKVLKGFSSQELKQRVLKLDEQKFKELLIGSLSQDKTNFKSSRTSPLVVSLPLPDGLFVKVKIYDSPILSPSISEQYPEIKTWRLQGVDNSQIRGRLDFTSVGFHGMLIMPDGDMVFIDPDTKEGETVYHSLSKYDNIARFKTDFNCKVHKNHSLLTFSPKKLSSKQLSRMPALDLITYRLALAGTGEYTASQGGTSIKAYESMVTTINRVNEIYRRDLGVKLEIVSDSSFAYINASTDPYTNSTATSLVAENINNFNANFGAGNYDIGHVFAQGRLGGLAYVGATCIDNYKAGGATGISNPQGEIFSIEYVAHEMGHQLGANHTFNSVQDGCGGGNRTAGTAMEPGSGSTIMSYSGLCGVDNIQYDSDAMFHGVSISQINDYTRAQDGRTCGSRTSTGNQKPVANAGEDNVIPSNTPFILVGSATGGSSYSWEQADAGSASRVSVDTGDNAIIRALLPSASTERYIPRLSNLFAGSTLIGEMLPQRDRTLNFAFIVRDGSGGVDWDFKALDVKNTGNRFQVLSQSSNQIYSRGEVIDITWQVGGTNLSPINCSKVNLQIFTVNGSKNILLADTNNDGSQQVEIPASTPLVSNARIMVECNNQPFFQISSGSITIQLGGGNIDITAPEITVLGEISVSIEKGTNYIDAGATAEDDIDGVVAVITTGNVDTAKVGVYKITYTAVDSAGNTSTIDRVIEVTPEIDRVAPVMTLLGESYIEIIQGVEYIDKGATAVDAVDGNVSVQIKGDVNTSVLGIYIITYTATDSTQNTVTIKRTVKVIAIPDESAPVIVLKGTKILTLFVGQKYNEPGYSALDAIDGAVKVIVTGHIDVNKIGSYVLIYTAKDIAGNIATKKRTIKIIAAPDTKPPVLTLVGETLISLTLGEEYKEPGFNAVDERDGVVDVLVTGKINVNKIGSYILTYIAKDLAGNGTSKKRTIKIIAIPDTKPPVITLVGESLISLTIGEEYIEPGFNAVDEKDGVVDVLVTGKININKIGSYVLIYTAKDTVGNTAITKRAIKVIDIPDETKPVVTLVGSSLVTLTKGEDFTEPGFSAVDSHDGDIPVIVTGVVNINKIGAYVITYKATDKAGNTATLKRTVIIKEEDKAGGGSVGFLLLFLMIMGSRRIFYTNRK